MAKRPKRKGRPAKFVLDENGKEVYGLSYNSASGMFYAAFSNPRVYFGGGCKRRSKSVPPGGRFKIVPL